jgi:hypothetical protein
MKRADAHVHVMSPTWFVRGNPVFPRAEKTNRRRQLSQPRPNMARTPRDQAHIDFARAIGRCRSADEQARLLLQDMDSAGLDKACLMVMDFDMTNTKVAVPHEKQLEELAAIRDKYPDRFVTFCGMDLRRGEDGIPIFERVVKDLGYAGLKLLPHWGFYPNDRKLAYPYYEVCTALNVPVTANCSAIGDSHIAAKYCHPINWEEVAYDFPQMNICLAHGGVPYHYEYALTYATMKHNIYMDIGDWQSFDSYQIGLILRIVRRAMDSAARYKIMFASDWPVFRAQYDEKEWVELFTRDAHKYGISFTDEELELLFWQNLQDYMDVNF